MRFRIVAVAALLVVSVVPAWADCESGMAALSRRIEDVRDARTRALLRQDLGRAGKEAAEDDEDECQEALDHAEGVLRERR